MSRAPGFVRKPSTLPPLKLSSVAPELSTGLSSYRNTFEKTLRPLFNNPDLSNEIFLNTLHNLLTGFIQFEQDILPPESHSILHLLKAKGYFRG